MRLLWVLLMLGGVIVLGGFGVLALYAIVMANGWSVLLDPKSLFASAWPLLAAGACAAGIFMKPSEFNAAMAPVEEEEVKPGAWIEEMRAEQDRDGAP